MTNKLIKYAELIREWSTERGLHDKDPRKQILKLGEEAGELFAGIAKKKVDLVKDAIGDVYVVIIIYCQQKGIDIDKVLEMFNVEERAYESNDNDSTLYSLKLMKKIGMLAGDTIYSNNNDSTRLQVTWVLEDLLTVCQIENLNFIECIEMAYNEIKDRKGEMKDGTFVKASDLENND
ncbi:MazG-like family protein [Macrococcus armenti]|uniref:MazG-like family protein n=1 Tax=Macrococcus armenti TaxID=2875764 RepID=UPI001CD745A4|nr:MazG-like family protein [Macrococcus armenti]UBH10622.1 MazG-like family protein [Macrococcus armenti]